MRDRVKLLCKERGAKFADLANVLGLSPSALSTTLKIGNPSLRRCKEIANFLGVTVSDIVGDAYSEERVEQTKLTCNGAFIPEPYSPLRLRITEVCKEKGILLKDLAQRLEISSVALSYALSRNITLEYVNKIAKAIDVPAYMLIESGTIRTHVTIECQTCGTLINTDLEIMKPNKKRP